MEMYGGVKVGEGEWSASHPDRFSPGTNWIES